VALEFLDDLNLSLAVTRVCFLIIGDGILVILVLKANLSGIKSKSYLPKKTKVIPPSLQLMTYVGLHNKARKEMVNWDKEGSWEGTIS
jgi:hypothetical protein